jgi:predicted nucleotidyltransferase component of viral defense system
MISKEELKEYAKIKGYNLGQAEKDYFQEIILFILYNEFGNDLVFKGGTALTKCYGFNRFSEDLDFNAFIESDFENIISNGLKKFYIDFSVESKKMKESLKIIYRIKGPLFLNQPNSACKIILDISFREKIFIEPVNKKIGLLINEIPSFDVVVMSLKEILSEKVRALMSRNKARDLYDLFYLVQRGVKFDFELINKKLDFYSLSFSLKEFKKSVEIKNIIWEKELKPLTRDFPKFNEVKSQIINSLKADLELNGYDTK